MNTQCDDPQTIINKCRISNREREVAAVTTTNTVVATFGDYIVRFDVVVAEVLFRLNAFAVTLHLARNFSEVEKFSRNIRVACVSACVLLFVVNDNNTDSSSNIAIIFALKASKVLIRSPTQQLNLSIFLSILTNQCLLLAIS